MNSISGFSGFNPQQLMQEMQQKLQAGDTDQNGAISRSEAEEISGLSSEGLDKMFGKLDADGNGELTQQEMQQAREDLQARMEQFGGFGNIGGGSSSTFDTLFESLNNDESESDKELKDILEELQQSNDDAAREQAMMKLNQALPVVDTFA